MTRPSALAQIFTWLSRHLTLLVFVALIAAVVPFVPFVYVLTGNDFL